MDRILRVGDTVVHKPSYKKDFCTGVIIDIFCDSFKVEWVTRKSTKFITSYPKEYLLHIDDVLKIDTRVFVPKSSSHAHFGSGFIQEINPQSFYQYCVKFDNGKVADFNACELELEKEPDKLITPLKEKPDGGPSDYYNLQNGGTLNNELEYKGETQWKGDSFHLSNIVKAAWRWGVKEGTTEIYDARKIIYTGCRLLMKYSSKSEMRSYLQKLLDDPQFKE